MPFESEAIRLLQAILDILKEIRDELASQNAGR
jgi:hypothetical protein